MNCFEGGALPKPRGKWGMFTGVLKMNMKLPVRLAVVLTCLLGVAGMAPPAGAQYH